MKRIALCFLGLALLLLASVVTEPQNRQASTTDLGAELEAYSRYVDDFHAAEQGASGPEFEATDYQYVVSVPCELRSAKPTPGQTYDA